MARTRVIRLVGFVFLALAAALLGRTMLLRTVADNPDAAESEPLPPNDPAHIEAIHTKGRRIEPLHAPKNPPQPGDWLDRHDEPGQTFDDYRAGDPHPPTPRRTTLYIQPWGDFDTVQSRLVAETADFLGRFYGVPVRTLERRRLEDVPSSARPKHPERGDAQLFTPHVLDVLQAERPKDALAVLALTTADLTPGEAGRWVFGQASLAERVGVWSLYRQGDPHENYTLCLRRTLKTAAHEAGHMLGIRHCKAYECGMNGSNSRAEADARPLWFCPEDETKVWWACRVEPRARYARLAEFAEQRGLDAEAHFWRASRDRE